MKKYYHVSSQRCEGDRLLHTGKIGYDDKLVITFNYKNGTKTVTFAELEESGIISDMDSTGEPKKSRLPFGSLLFLSFFFWLEQLHRAQSHAAAVHWRSRRHCLWQMKAARAHGRHPYFSRANRSDEKYAGANEKCRPYRQAKKSRAPQESPG